MEVSLIEMCRLIATHFFEKESKSILSAQFSILFIENLGAKLL